MQVQQQRQQMEQCEDDPNNYSALVCIELEDASLALYLLLLPINNSSSIL